MKLDRSKLAPAVTGNAQERYIEDDEYAETLLVTLKMLGAVTLVKHPYADAVGYVVGEATNTVQQVSGNDAFATNNWRFLMGKKSAGGKWQVHPSRINWFLNGGWNAR